MIENALQYANDGWPVFPCKPDKTPYTRHGFKDATRDIDQIKVWWQQWPNALIGIPTGKTTGTVVIDVDVKNGAQGIQSAKLLAERYGKPETRRAKTISGGYHSYFQYPENGEIRSRAGFLPGIDIRADGGYVIAPPSRINGSAYEWMNGLQLAPLPDGLAVECIESAKGGPNTDNESLIPLGERNARLTSFAGSMRRRGMSVEAITAALLEENAARCIEPLPEDEVRRIAQSISKYPVDDDGLSHLADLSNFEYERVRKQAAKRFGVRVSVLDKLVKSQRSTDSEDSSKQGERFEVEEIEHWTEPIEPSILNDIARSIDRHAVLPKHAADTVALWAAHAHMFDEFHHTPRLLVTAPAQECGKTVLTYHLLGNLVPRKVNTESMSPAVYFRLAHAQRPTMLIDEADQFFRQDADILRSINGGFEPTGGVQRCEGDENEVRNFRTFCPVVISGINIADKLPGATLSRCIAIQMERASPEDLNQHEIYDARRHKKEMEELGCKLARWVADYRDQISNTDPEMPHGVINRIADKWGPLFAIAEVAGGDWPKRVKNALQAQPDISEPTKGEQLLQDMGTFLRNYDTSSNNDVIFTEEILNELVQVQDGGNWRDHNFKERDADRRRITDRQVAKLLKPYQLKPRPVRRGSKNLRGYYVADLLRVCHRYAPPSEPSHRHNTAKTVVSARSYPSQPKSVVTARKDERADKNRCCDAVTDETRRYGARCINCSNWAGRCVFGNSVSDPTLPRECGKYEYAPRADG